MAEETFLSTRRTKRTQRSECQICSSSALYRYFGVLSCNARKVFFRRNAHYGQVRFFFFERNSQDNLFRIMSNMFLIINVRLLRIIIIYVHHADFRNALKKE